MLHFTHISYHPSKANVVADALSRKERVKPIRINAKSVELRTSLNEELLDAQKQALFEANASNEGLGGTVDQLAPGKDGILRFNDHIWVPIFGRLRDLILQEAHNSRYSVHPGGNKMYQHLKKNYWWMGMKKSIATYVAK
ncbi:putative integrase zinc-binding domain-containing protein [Helianthus annuus]|nr:putative integrase zinc-binding domain-containing protein [Helianthus annuus]